MDNGLSDMAQVMNVTATYGDIAVKLSAMITRNTVNAVKNLCMLIFHSFLENKKGKTSLWTMNKLTKNPDFVHIYNDKEFEKNFLKLCKQHGIPTTKVKGLKDGEITHWIYPKEYASLMESVMQQMTEYGQKRFQKEGLSADEAKRKAEETNRKETLEEASQGLGCDMPHKEFKKQFLEKLATPEEKTYYAELDKKKPKISDDKKKEIMQAAKNNESRNKSNKFEQDGLYSVSFTKDQIIGTVERNHEKFVKVRFENDYSQAFLVNLKNLVKLGDKLHGAFNKDGDITLYNLKDHSEKTVRFKDFISGNTQSKTESTTRTRERANTKNSQTQQSSSLPAAPKVSNRNNSRGKR